MEYCEENWLTNERSRKYLNCAYPLKDNGPNGISRMSIVVKVVFLAQKICQFLLSQHGTHYRNKPDCANNTCRKTDRSALCVIQKYSNRIGFIHSIYKFTPREQCGLRSRRNILFAQEMQRLQFWPFGCEHVCSKAHAL